MVDEALEMKAFSIRALCAAGSLLLGLIWSMAVMAASPLDLLETSERLDKADQQGFAQALAKAKGCTQSRDFSCAEKSLEQAGKLVTRSQDRTMLASAKQGLASEKQRAEQEAAAQAERERQARANSYSGSSGNSSSSSGGEQWYRCRFCCEGQWGSCMSGQFEIKIRGKYGDLQEAIRKQYGDACKRYPFYAGGGGSASVSFSSCDWTSAP